MVVLVGAESGCDGPSTSEDVVGPKQKQKILGEGIAQGAKTTLLDSSSFVVGFEEGSLWVVDLGDYACDNTPGDDSSQQALCVAPENTSLRRMNLESDEVVATVTLGCSEAGVGLGAAFGAGSVRVSTDDGVLRLDPSTNQITHKIPVPASGLAFGEGAIWATSIHDGMVSRIEPTTNEVVKKIEASNGGASDMTVGKGAV